MSKWFSTRYGLDEHCDVYTHIAANQPDAVLSCSATNALIVLDALSYAGFLLDSLRRVLALNSTALSWMGDGLVLGGEHLRATEPATDERLQCLIASATRRVEDLKYPLMVAVQRRARLPVVIQAIFPYDGGGSIPGSVHLLLGLDPELRRVPPRELLTQAFGLTPVEADVASGIVFGKTLAEIAADRGVKIETVRVHLKRSFSKTHTHGQAELTGLLTRLAFLVPQFGASVPRALLPNPAKFVKHRRQFPKPLTKKF